MKKITNYTVELFGLTIIITLMILNIYLFATIQNLEIKTDSYQGNYEKCESNIKELKEDYNSR